MNVIKSSSLISDVFTTGKRFNGKNLSVIIKDYDTAQRDQLGRVAFIAGKKLGNAVLRNRSKRVMREAARQAGLPLNGRDIVIIANRRTATADHDDVVSSLDGLLSRARVR